MTEPVPVRQPGEIAGRRVRLGELEIIIREGIVVFRKVGDALAEIRDGRLYRESGYSTFESYCIHRWGIRKSQSYNIIRAAETVSTIVEVLPSDTPLPRREGQVRPLVPLARENPVAAAQAWQAAIQGSSGTPTAQDVLRAVSEIAARKETEMGPPPPTSETVLDRVMAGRRDRARAQLRAIRLAIRGVTGYALVDDLGDEGAGRDELRALEQELRRLSEEIAHTLRSRPA